MSLSNNSKVRLKSSAMLRTTLQSSVICFMVILHRNHGVTTDNDPMMFIFDANKDGYATAEEITNFYKNTPEITVDAIFQVGDINKDGSLSETELVKVLTIIKEREINNIIVQKINSKRNSTVRQ